MHGERKKKDSRKEEKPIGKRKGEKGRKGKKERKASKRKGRQSKLEWEGRKK